MAERVIPELTESDKARFWIKIQKGERDECWPWLFYKNKAGYGGFSIRNVFYLANRLAWSIENGRIPDGLDILHSCDNPACCNPSHLRAGTHKENMQDMSVRGRSGPKNNPNCMPRGDNHHSKTNPGCMLKGEQVHLSKLKESDVISIREEHKNSKQKIKTLMEIADRYGMRLRSIYSVVLRETWKHI